jgi:16S rRNA (cytosine1402-N4)-methyltransferase
MMTSPHVPVLLEETLTYLQPGPSKRIVDGTYGFGGHAAVCLDEGAEVLGLDLDDEAVAECQQAMARRPRLHCRKMSFRHLDAALGELNWPGADGVLLDLGVSSRQLDAAEKGFTYRNDVPLDLRFDRSRGEPARDLLARLPEAELADILWEYGEERAARRVAQAIVRGRERRELSTTGRLRAVIEEALPPGLPPQATLSRCFQALRIAVNDELGALAEALERIPTILAPGGRAVIIAYHSLEDRLVKRWLERESRDCICPPELPLCRCGHQRTLRPLTRKPLRPSALETRANPRARSARLRAAERLADERRHT